MVEAMGVAQRGLGCAACGGPRLPLCRQRSGRARTPGHLPCKLCSDQLDTISIAIKVKEGLVDAYRQALVILPSRVEHTLAMQRPPARELFISATRRGGSQALARVRALVTESDLFKILSIIRDSGLGGEGDGQAEGRAVEDEVQTVGEPEEAVPVPRSPAGRGRARAGSVSSRASSVGRRR